LLVDDVLAMDGTAAAAYRLIERAGSSVAGAALLIELGGLEGGVGCLLRSAAL
jgi:adenine/guanine phosphoribosyltransferase-like PRPP-binding protein